MSGKSSIEDDMAADQDAKSVRRPLAPESPVVANPVEEPERSVGLVLALPSFSCGGPLPGIDLDHALQLDATLDTEHIRLKLLAGR